MPRRRATGVAVRSTEHVHAVELSVSATEHGIDGLLFTATTAPDARLPAASTRLPAVDAAAAHAPSAR
jgi:hypothetical protein